jgi:hypothetical protein
MLTATSPEILEFIAAYQENQDTANHRTGGWYQKAIAEDRKKYIAIDEVDRDATPPFHYPHISHRGGRFLIDKETGVVYSIKGYGQRGYRVGTVESMPASYRKATASFDPNSSVHMEARGSNLATSPRRPGLTVLQGGQARERVDRALRYSETGPGRLLGRTGDRAARRRGER